MCHAMAGLASCAPARHTPAMTAPLPTSENNLVFTTNEADMRERLDKVLAAHMAQIKPEISRTRVQALVKERCVRVDGVVVDDPKTKAREGQLIEITLPRGRPAGRRTADIPLEILFEDDDLLVLNKAPGMVVHPAPGNPDGTLVNALLHHCRGKLSGIGGVERPGIVHRLDKDTTGLMVVAKNDRAHQHLAAQFADHGREGPLERAYIAIVWGDPTRTLTIVDAPLDRDPRNREKMAVLSPKRHAAGFGRHAITHIAKLKSYPPGSANPVASMMRCTLETGRTHQIRVHMAHVGHPLLGDRLYGEGFKTKISMLNAEAGEALLALKRQALHATVLGFVIGSLVGFVLGLLFGRYRTVADIFDPFITALYSIPKIALAPLFIIWFGIGIESKVAVSASIVFFVVFLNTYAGVRDVNPIYVHATRIMGGNELAVLRHVMIPSATSWVITGLKVSVPYALVGTVIGEFMSSNRGIGFIIAQATGLFDTTSVFSGLVILGLVGALINVGLRHAETWLLRWKAQG